MKCKMGEETRIIIDEEVKNLKEEMFILKIKYLTWLENVVIVKESSGK